MSLLPGMQSEAAMGTPEEPGGVLIMTYGSV